MTIPEHMEEGVSFNPDPLMVDEGTGATYMATYTVVLDRPLTGGDATVTLSSEDNGVAGVGTNTVLTFAPNNWDMPQTVTVTGMADDNAQDETVTVSHTLAWAASSNYETEMQNIGTMWPLTVTVDDNEQYRVDISPIATTVAEGGSIDSYTVVLASEPVGGDVIVTPSSSNTMSVMNPAPLTFTATAGNWNTAQTVSVTSVADANAVRETVTLSHTVTGADYETTTELTVGDDVVVEVNEAQTRGVTISGTNIMGPRGSQTLTIREGTSTTYTVVLDSEPVVTSAANTTTVVINLAAVDPVTVEPMSLNFDNSDWNMAQTVTVTGQEDNTDANNDTVIVSHTPQAMMNTDYEGVMAVNLEVTVDDNDRPSVNISPAVLSLSEIASPTGPPTEATYTVALSIRPDGSVTITPTNPDTGAVTVAPSLLNFDNNNWNAPQTVTVTRVDDDDAQGESVIVSHTLGAMGGLYEQRPPDNVPNVRVTVTDNGENRGVNFEPIPGGGTVDEGDSTPSYTVVLTSQPVGGNVTITPNSDSGAVTVPALTFTPTPGNWDAPQTVSVTSVRDDNAVDETVNVSHTLQASGTDYDGFTITDPDANVVVMVDDGQTVGVVTDVTALTVRESETETAPERIDTYTVSLSSQPVGGDGNVTITPTSDTPGSVMVPSTPLTFTASTWNMLQTVTVTSVDDANSVDESVTVSNTAAGADYNGRTANVQVTVIDDDPRRVMVFPDALTVAEGGSETYYTVVLESQPVGGDVTITPTSDNEAAVTVDPTLTFGPGNWSTPQSVTVTGEEDNDNAFNETVTVSHTLSGSDYGTAMPMVTVDNVTVSVTDNDVPSVLVSAPTPLTLSEEGGTDTYTVRLGNAAPAGPVTITPSISDMGAATVAPTLVFSPGNWNTPQSVTVTGVDDEDAVPETVTVTHSVVSPDHPELMEDNVVDNVTVTVMDQDSRELRLMDFPANFNEGATQTYTVSLSAPPVGGDVTVTIGRTIPAGAEGAGQVVVTPTALTFSDSNWNTPQMVAVYVAEDDNGEGGMVQLSHTVGGADYQGETVMGAGTMNVPVADDDRREVTVTPNELTVVRGRTGTYSVRLETAPFPAGAAVTVTAMLPAGAQVSLTPAVLTFSDSNWATAQEFSVTPAMDAPPLAEPLTISHTVAGADYGSATPPVTADPVMLTIIASNLGEINQVILSEVARVMADQQISAISRRLSQAGQSGAAAGFNLSGQSTLAGLAAANAENFVADDIDLKRMLGNSDFVLPLHASGAGGSPLGSPVLWGGGDYRDLSGESDSIEWDGDVFSVHLGIDARLRSGLVAGLMVSDSEGDLEYDAADNQQGDYDVDMTSVNPYLGWSVMGGSVDMWATAGYGEGDVEITPDDNPDSPTTADLTMRMAALGGSGDLSSGERTTLRLKGEAFYTSTRVDDTTTDRRAAMVGDSNVDAHRARMTLEMESRYALASGAQLKPSVEAGFRLDGGDGRSGSGLEMGGGLHYHDAVLGLTLESRARGLVGHSGDYEEWSVSGSVLLDPGADGRGLSLAVSPSYGSTGSGVQRIWNDGLLDQEAEKRGDSDLQARLTARLGYGLSAAPLHGRWLGLRAGGLLTPYSAMTLGEDKQKYRFGLEWGAGESFGIDLFTTREQKNGKADDSVLLKGEVRF